MCDMAPQIIYLFDRMGVPFSRTKEGLLDFRRFGGTLHHRTAFAGASTGQQLLYALDEQVRKWEVEGRVTKWEGWEMLSLVLDDHQVCRGLVAMDLESLKLKSFAADCSDNRDRRPGLDLWKIDEFHDLHGQPPFRPVINKARVMRTASSFRSTRPQSLARTS
jgi:succinate dehydrogenase / fumarate reductase flavoprotein subunit